ncbi:MAG TPA: methyltransferase domain-containing protein [Gammaproteobacteria bacterium]|nr:methyltransferase domain-containing protein [Gammaproteobacteria bacterium]HIL97427.1 methyltransferase domain-containing protein [Pseudomonadales bacterium]
MMRKCPLCSDNHAEVVCNQRYCLEETSLLPPETAVVACSGCGFVFARSDKTASDYSGYYSEQTKYESTVNASGSGEYELDKKRITDLVYTLTEGQATDMSVLDIGAAKGGVLVEFQRKGYKELFGVDASEACVKSMHSYGIEACIGSLEDDGWAVDPRQFDLIILSHVLEHVFDVVAGLASARRRLTPGGTIYVEVPDASRYTVEGFPPYYFFDPEHINHFDLDSLRLMAAHEGLVLSKWQAKELDVGAASSYPAIAVWLVAQTDADKPEPEINSAEAIQHYVEASAATLMALPNMALLQDLVKKDAPIVIWGAGSHAKRLLANGPLVSANLVAIIDSDTSKHGKLLRGVEICSAQRGLQRAQDNNATIVVAIAVNADEVLTELHSAVDNLSIISV